MCAKKVRIMYELEMNETTIERIKRQIDAHIPYHIVQETTSAFEIMV